MLTVGNGNGSGTFSGIIQNTSGTLTLVKTGSGAQYLAGANTYGGGTQINSGILNFKPGACRFPTSRSAVEPCSTLVATPLIFQRPLRHTGRNLGGHRHQWQ